MNNSSPSIIAILLALILGAFFPFLYIFIIPIIIYVIWSWYIAGRKNYKEVEEQLEGKSMGEIAQLWQNSKILSVDPMQTVQVRRLADRFVKVIEEKYPMISTVQPIPDIAVQPFFTGPDLHEVIVEVLKAAGTPLTVSEITVKVNELGTYKRYDGQPVDTSQVNARINKYPSLFVKDKSVKPMKISLK